jgi:uncharacterized cupin superfamily protein
MKSFSKINLREVEDSAVKYGYKDNHEARFPTKLLGLEHAGLSLQKLLPGKRSLFGHAHKVQEELLIVLEGTGQMKLNDEIIDLKKWDAVRIAPGTMQAVKAGSEGLEFLIFGAPKTPEKDWEMVKGWWDEV